MVKKADDTIKFTAEELTNPKALPAASVIDRAKLRRKKDDTPVNTEPEDVRVTSGPVDKAIDLAFNPTRDKLREVTIIDRVQGRLFPLLDTINVLWTDVLEVAEYRLNPDAYRKAHPLKPKPMAPNLIDEFMFRTAQWQKSVQGTNLTKITDIALAETETRANDDGGIGGSADLWGKE